AAGLRTLLRTPMKTYSQLAGALAFMTNLPPDEVVPLLVEHAQHLSDQIGSARARLDFSSQLGVDRVFIIEDLYSLALLDTKERFLRQLIQEIRDGILTETVDGARRWKVVRPELAQLAAPPEEIETSHEAEDDAGDE